MPNAFGQLGKNDAHQPNNPYDTPPWIAEQNRQRKKLDEQHGRDKNGMIIPTPVRKTVPPMTDEQKETLRENLRNYEITLRRLQAPAVYYKKYESFLKDYKTGLARLFVDRNCDEGKTVSVEELERCGDFISVKGGGSYYPFRVRKNNGYPTNWWDIHFISEKLKVGNDLVQMVITEVGDVDLNAISLNSKAFEFLKKYKAKGTVEEIKEQNKVLEKGINSNGFTYSNSAAVNFNSTYVFRTVAYLLEGETPVDLDKLDSLDRYYRSAKGVKDLNRYNGSGKGLDIIIAFRIVGREKDGSLILLWKELKMELPRRKLK